MTVAELIAKLSTLPPDLRVFVSTNDHNGGLSPAREPEVEFYRYDAGDREHHIAWEGEERAGKCVVLSPEEFV
jgi:hypothetical protein